MKPFPIISAVLLFVLAPAICRANLGETEDRCIARYGPESNTTTDVGYRQVGDKAALFSVKTAAATLDIKVIFLNGASCHEVISNSDSAAGLTEDQMKALLDAQSAGMKWRKGKTLFRSSMTSTYGTTDWLRSDGATARFYISGKAESGIRTGQMEISTKQYADAQRVYDKENGDN